MNYRTITYIIIFCIVCLFYWWGKGQKSIVGGEAFNNKYELSFVKVTISGKPQNNNFIPAGQGTLVELNIDGNPDKLENLNIFDYLGNEIELAYDEEVLKNGLEVSENANSLWLYKNSNNNWAVGYSSESDIGEFNIGLDDFGWIFLQTKDGIFITVILAAFLLLYFIQKSRQGEKIYLRPIAGLKAL